MCISYKEIYEKMNISSQKDIEENYKYIIEKLKEIKLKGYNLADLSMKEYTEVLAMF